MGAKRKYRLSTTNKKRTQAIKAVHLNITLSLIHFGRAFTCMEIKHSPRKPSLAEPIKQALNIGNTDTKCTKRSKKI